jgi:hypothetical protein
MDRWRKAAMNQEEVVSGRIPPFLRRLVDAAE